MCPRRANPGVRDALLAAARTEFALHGLAKARLQDITRRAGVSKGAFYLHFGTKEDAYRQILEQFFAVLEDLVHRHELADARFVEAHGRLTAGDIVTGTERYRRALEMECDCDTELLETLWRNRSMLAILDSSRGSAFIPVLTRFRQRITDFVVKGGLGTMASGCLRDDLDRAAVGDLVVGAYEAFARRMIPMRRKPDLRAWARTLLIVIRQGAVEHTGRCVKGGTRK